MIERYFLYGTLREPALFHTVVGRPLAAFEPAAAMLDDHDCVPVAGEGYPSLIPAPDRRVPGLLVAGLGTLEAARLRFYEGTEFVAISRTVRPRRGEACAARLFVARPGIALDEATRWSFAGWRGRAQALRHAQAWMKLFGEYAPDDPELERRWREIVAGGRTVSPWRTPD